ncbi:hypothetical protein EMIT0158MI4_80114 [Burkholderia ambifaria]
MAGHGLAGRVGRHRGHLPERGVERVDGGGAERIVAGARRQRHGVDGAHLAVVCREYRQPAAVQFLYPGHVIALRGKPKEK